MNKNCVLCPKVKFCYSGNLLFLSENRKTSKKTLFSSPKIQAGTPVIGNYEGMLT